MAGIKISDLPARTTVDDTMTLAVDTGTNTYKITVGDYNHSATETARQYANASATSATESAASAASAQNSLNQVITVAGNAATSASNAAASATEAAASATSASGFKEDSESWANGQRGGVDVPNTDPAYHNNSKYHSEQSAAYSVASKGEKENSEAWAVGTKNGAPVSPSDPQYANSAKHWAQQAAAVAHIDPMDNDTMGIGIPDGRTTEATNGTFSAIGTTALATINPNASADYASDWLLDSDNNVITPDARYQYRVSSGGSASLYYWTGSVYTLLSGGGGSGHTIMNSSAIPMAGMANLQFGGEYDPVSVENVVSGNKTIVHGQLFICDSESDWNTLSDADFKAKYGADREQVGVYWYLPWATENVYSSDKTPIGTVITVATGKTGDGITGITTPTNPFPNKDYLICNGNLVQISEYPQLANHFEEVYDDKFYFTNGVDPGNGRFQLPNWSVDYPENGILCIKARITSDVITLAEVDETGLSSRTDEVPSCARVAGIESSKITVIKDISDLGISTGGLLADFVKAMPSKSYAQISATANTTFTDVPRTGELYIFKPFGNEVIHKTMILEYVAAQSTTSFADAVAVGFIPYNGGVSTNSKWFAPTLTALN